MDDFLAVSKALADKNRIRIVLALGSGELCVCQIIELLDLAPSTVSKHISILKSAKVLHSRKDGRWNYYRLADDSAPGFIRNAIDWVQNSLGNDPETISDRKQLEEILSLEPCELCCCQSGKKERNKCQT